MQSAEFHLEQAFAHTNELAAERGLQGDNVHHSQALLQQDQGRAMRLVIYHGLAAIVEAIKERP